MLAWAMINDREITIAMMTGWVESCIIIVIIIIVIIIIIIIIIENHRKNDQFWIIKPMDCFKRWV